MLWIFFSLLSAISQSTRDLLSKKSLKDLNEYTVVFSTLFFSSICLLPSLFFIEIPSLDLTFWLIIIINGSIIAGSFVLYLRALKLSPLSLTIPMLAFTPLFLLVTSPIILGEFPSYIGLTGISLIFLGAYTLSIKDIKKGYLAPFKALSKEKGARIMLLVAFIFSIASNLFKIGVQHSNPFIYPLINNLFVCIVVFPFMIIKTKNSFKLIRLNIKKLFLIGFFDSMLNVFSLLALEIEIVPYVNSVRRSSILFSTIFGYFFFKEKNIKERLAGVILMMLGILLISVF